jgi:hypothetical protein
MSHTKPVDDFRAEKSEDGSEWLLVTGDEDDDEDQIEHVMHHLKHIQAESATPGSLAASDASSVVDGGATTRRADAPADVKQAHAVRKTIILAAAVIAFAVLVGGGLAGRARRTPLTGAAAGARGSAIWDDDIDTTPVAPAAAAAEAPRVSLSYTGPLGDVRIVMCALAACALLLDGVFKAHAPKVDARLSAKERVPPTESTQQRKRERATEAGSVGLPATAKPKSAPSPKSSSPAPAPTAASVFATTTGTRI